MRKVGIAIMMAAMTRQRSRLCSRACRRRERSSIDVDFSSDGLKPGDSSAAKILRIVTSGGEGVYRMTMTGLLSVVGVKSTTPEFDCNTSATFSGQLLHSEFV